MRLGFRRNADYVAVKNFFRLGSGPVRAGEPVKGSLATLRRFYRRKKIGIVGNPWTQKRLGINPTKERKPVKSAKRKTARKGR